MPEDGFEQSRIPGSRRPDGHELGVECDVDSCDERVVGLDDGWEYDRGIVCTSCIKYRSRHNHWPDEDQDHCRECILDDGGDVHDCSETSIDVLLRPGDECPECGFELAATDGGRVGDESGLYEKYEVYKNGEPVEGCFVLEPGDDSAAREALIRYAEATDNEELADDLREWVTEICTRGETDA